MITNVFLGQALAGSLLLGTLCCSGIYLNSMNPIITDYLVSKADFPEIITTASAPPVSAAAEQYKCRISKHIDETCKIFSIDSLGSSKKIQNIKDFIAASTEATEAKIKSDNFFKIKLNTQNLKKIQSEKTTWIEIIKKNDSSNTVYAKFKIHAFDAQGSFSSHVQHFVVKIPDSITTDALFDKSGNHQYTCALNPLNIFVAPLPESFHKCVIDRIDPKIYNKKSNTIPFVEIKNKLDEFPISGNLDKTWLSQDLLYIVQTSYKYWNRTNKKPKFTLKITMDNDYREFSINTIGTIAAKTYGEKEIASAKTSPDETGTTKNSASRTKIKDIYEI